jgi:hypothetical protein
MKRMKHSPIIVTVPRGAKTQPLLGGSGLTFNPRSVHVGLIKEG